MPPRFRGGGGIRRSATDTAQTRRHGLVDGGDAVWTGPCGHLGRTGAHVLIRCPARKTLGAVWPPLTTGPLQPSRRFGGRLTATPTAPDAQDGGGSEGSEGAFQLILGDSGLASGHVLLDHGAMYVHTWKKTMQRAGGPLLVLAAAPAPAPPRAGCTVTPTHATYAYPKSRHANPTYRRAPCATLFIAPSFLGRYVFEQAQAVDYGDGAGNSTGNEGAVAITMRKSTSNDNDMAVDAAEGTGACAAHASGEGKGEGSGAGAGEDLTTDGGEQEFVEEHVVQGRYRSRRGRIVTPAGNASNTGTAPPSVEGGGQAAGPGPGLETPAPAPADARGRTRRQFNRGSASSNAPLPHALKKCVEKFVLACRMGTGWTREPERSCGQKSDECACRCDVFCLFVFATRLIDAKECTVFLDIDDNFYKKWGGSGSAATKTKRTIDRATQMFTIANTAFVQNFGSIVKLKLAGAKVWSEAPNTFYTSGSLTQCVTTGIIRRYGEFLLYGKGGKYIPYDSKTRKGEQSLAARARSGKGMRGKDLDGKDLPAGEDVCMNYLMVHKAMDGAGGVAFRPSHEFEGKSNCGAWSDAVSDLTHEEDAKIGGKKRRAFGRCNVGVQTSMYCSGGCSNCKVVDYEVWRGARTFAHELGHAFSSRHDYASERPNKGPQCRPDTTNRFIMDLPPRAENTAWNTKTGVYKFSPCSQGDISMFIWDRRDSGLFFQGDLGKCQGVRCGGVCSGQYCDFNTGKCRKYTDDKPQDKYTYNMDGWPCDTRSAYGTITAVGYCRNNKCEQKAKDPATNTPITTLLVSIIGTKVDPWAGGLYTRTRRRSHGSAVYVKQAGGTCTSSSTKWSCLPGQGGLREYTLARGSKTRLSPDGKQLVVDYFEWKHLIHGEAGSSTYRLKDTKQLNILDWADFIGRTGLPWTASYQGDAKFDVRVEAGPCQHILLTGHHKPMGKRAVNGIINNVYTYDGVRNGRGYYVGGADTWTTDGQPAGQPSKTMHLGWEEYISQSGTYIYRWRFTDFDQRLKVSAVNYGAVYDYAGSPHHWSGAGTFNLWQGLWTILDGKTTYAGWDGPFKLPQATCDKPRPKYSSLWQLHTGVVRCTRWNAVDAQDKASATAPQGTKYTQHDCAALCAERDSCDTFMLSSSGTTCLMMRGPCMSGGTQKGTYDVYRLGRGSCDQLSIKDSNGGKHAGEWHQAGFEHGRRPVFCEAKGLGCWGAIAQRGSQALALYLDLLQPAWVVSQYRWMCHEGIQMGSRAPFDKNQLDGTHNILELQNEAAKWTSTKGNGKTTALCVQTVATVQTTGGNVKEGSRCTLPFVHKGVTYNDCATVALPDKQQAKQPWCLAGSQAVGAKWGYCAYRRECTKDEASECTADKLEVPMCTAVECKANFYRATGNTCAGAKRFTCRGADNKMTTVCCAGCSNVACAKGSFRSGSCTGATNRFRCNKCTSCVKGKYIGTQCAATTDAKCSACGNVDCQNGKFRSGVCEGAKNGYQCGTCSNTNCASNQYRSGSCSGVTNGYRCNSQPKCSSGQYLVGVSKTAKGTCKTCTNADCGAITSKYRSGACSGTTNGFKCNGQPSCLGTQFLKAASQNRTRCGSRCRCT